MLLYRPVLTACRKRLPVLIGDEGNSGVYRCLQSFRIFQSHLRLSRKEMLLLTNHIFFPLCDYVDLVASVYIL